MNMNDLRTLDTGTLMEMLAPAPLTIVSMDFFSGDILGNKWMLTISDGSTLYVRRSRRYAPQLVGKPVTVLPKYERYLRAART
jgi:hypothetical protein